MSSSTSHSTSDRAILWSPTESLRVGCAMTRFIKALEARGYGSFPTYEDLHTWSVTAPHSFWREVVEFVGIRGEGTLDPLWESGDGPTPLAKRWFPSFKINFAENLLGSADDSTAITAWSEDRLARKITRAELKDLTLSFAEHLKGIGVGSSDRIFAYLPNIPEAVVCMLGSAAVGATWSSCGTDYQVDGLLGRLTRVQPKVFIAPLAYQWRGKEVDASQTIIDVVRQTPSIEHVILVDYLGGGDARTIRGANLKVGWADLVSILAVKSGNSQLEKFPFSHPLYIMFSSGTTGKPKGIVHAAGGTLLEHTKEHILHSDVRPGDVLFYQTSTSWMMWNWLMSGLAAQATIVLYDGDPLLEDGMILWRMAEQERVTHFGTSAAFLGASEKQGVRPGERVSLQSLRALLSTGSTLYPSQFDYIRSSIKPIWIQSISGGTDILGCFGLGAPLKPVVRGEVQAKSLGYDVCVYNSKGERVVGEEGELICANPAPSMPVCFLDDPSGEAYRAAYFSEYPAVWRHGDFLEERFDGGLLFLGRSDATLKPAGVRVATADIYAALHRVQAVQQALAVGYLSPGATSEKIVIFVVLEMGVPLTDELRAEIRETLRRSNAFYVPAAIIQAPDVPRTSNNKLSEISVKRLLKGEDPGNASALANPTALEFFKGEGLRQVKEALGG